jgi:hypothetical protein
MAMLCSACAMGLAVLWVRSHAAYNGESVSVSFWRDRSPLGTQRSVCVMMIDGVASLGYVRTDFRTVDTTDLYRSVFRWWGHTRWNNTYSIAPWALNRSASKGPQTSRYEHGVQVPAWFATIALLSPAMTWATMFWVRRRRRADRLDANRCLTCGYDLRASTGRCPECGSVIPVEQGRSHHFA